MTLKGTARRADVVVIGAGQAGLSTAYHLQRQGLTPGSSMIVLDRGPGAGGAWQHRWESLRLGDAHRVHDLPGASAAQLSFDDAPHDQPARDVVAKYYAEYEDFYALRVERPRTVTSVERSDHGYLVKVDSEPPIDARVVVNASGTWGSPRIPRIPGAGSFCGAQVTTAEYTSKSDFAGQRVAIVGAGTSALGFLDELREVAAHVHWFTRRPPEFIAAPQLRQELGVRAVRLQDEAARAGRPLPSLVSVTGIPLTPRVRAMRDAGTLERHPMFTRFVQDGVVRQDGVTVPLDAVIWATGFEAHLGHLAPVGVSASGVRVEEGRVMGEPSLFLAGYGPQASTISANRGGRTIARQVRQVLGSAPA